VVVSVVGIVVVSIVFSTGMVVVVGIRPSVVVVVDIVVVGREVHHRAFGMGEGRNHQIVVGWVVVLQMEIHPLVNIRKDNPEAVVKRC